MKKITLNHSLTCALGAGAVLLAVSSASAQQNLFVGDYYPGGLSEDNNGTVTPFGSGTSGPVGLAFDTSGNLFVANGNLGGGDGFITEYAANGSATPFAIGLNDPNGLAFNSAGILFESDYANGNIYDYTTAGVQSTFATGLNDAIGLAFNPAGNLFVADAGTGNVYEYIGTTRITVATGLNNPWGVAFDGAGNLFVSDQNTGNIYELMNNNGSFSTPTVYYSGLNDPNGITFDSSGNLWVSVFGAGAVEEITTQKTIGMTTTVNGPTGLAFKGEALPVPEPSTFGLLGVGVAGLLARRFRKN
jgi:glucose/arabinose dehydrogenase